MKKKIRNKLLIIISGTVFFLIAFFFVLHIFYPINININYSQHVLDRNGETIHMYLTKDDKWRLKTDLDEISDDLKKAVIYKEDKYFYKHFGVNPFALCRALANNILAGKRTSGASTITMQVARLLEPKERTYKNKLIEIFRAFQIEYKFSKDEILQMYLNLVPYGGNIEGVKSASVLYLNKMPDHLSLAEITALSIIPNRPTSLKLQSGNENILISRNKWLRRFKDEKVFSATVVDDALIEPINIERKNAIRSAPHFSRKMTNENKNLLNIQTTLDLNIQLTVEEIVKNYSNRLQSLNIQNSAVLILDNESNEVISYIGSADFNNDEDGGQVDGIKAIRSPGSTLKPLIYALGFDNGIITPQKKISDLPIEYSGYSPNNYNENYAGLVTAEKALQQSLNIPAVNLLNEMKTTRLIEVLNSMGFDQIGKDKSKLGLSLALGGCGVSLEDLTAMYSIFNKNGNWQPVKTLLKKKQSQSKNIISESSAYIVSDILSQLDRPDYPGNYANIANTPKIAWKTGTSFGRKDAWSIGYNDKYTIGVWAGNFSSVGVPELNGAAIATPLLFEIFNEISNNDDLNNKLPEEIKHTWVCNETGKIPSDHCDNQVIDLYINLSSKHEKCDHLKKIFVSKDHKTSYCKHCLSNIKHYTTKWIKNYPTDLIAYYEQNKIAYEKIPRHNPDCEKFYNSNDIKIVSPKSNITYYLVEEENSEIMLKSETNADVSKTYWYINDEYYVATNFNEDAYFQPQTGKSKITCVDDKGRMNSIIIDVSYIN